MAGGKETPRQKMIGMMYLVLTALLALNVSKSILDAFVNIEENIQIGNITEHQRGTTQILGVKEKLVNDEGFKSPKAAAVYDAMLDIDKLTAEKIQLIDKVKLLIFQATQEDLDPKAEEPICILAKGQVLNFTDDKNPRLTKDVADAIVPFVKPLRMNLHNVSGKDKFDEQMLVMGINESIEEPKKDAPGFAVWPAMIDYRKKLPNILVKISNKLAKMDSLDKSFTFKDPNINKYKDLNDLGKKLDKALKSIDKQDPGLAYELKKIYTGLTKNEKIPDPNEETGPLHWIGMTFDHAPAVAAIAALSGLQSEILTARADALTYLAGLVGGGSYSFNAVEGRAFAPPSATAGATVKMDVMMVAYDTEKQPIVEPDQGKVVGVPRNGKATVEFTAPSSGEMVLTGKVAIKDKNGIPKFATYETNVQVVTKAGSVSLPEVSVFYTEWPNKVSYSAAGVVSSDISCSGCSRSAAATWTSAGTQYKGKKLWVAPGVRQVKISLSGKDAEGNSVNFGVFTYNVKGFPKPVVLTPSLSKDRGGFLNVGLPPSSPLQGVNYTVLSGDINGSGFSGNRVTAANLASIRRGKTAGIYIRVRRSDNGKIYNIAGAVPVN